MRTWWRGTSRVARWRHHRHVWRRLLLHGPTHWTNTTRPHHPREALEWRRGSHHTARWHGMHRAWAGAHVGRRRPHEWRRLLPWQQWQALLLHLS